METNRRQFLVGTAAALIVAPAAATTLEPNTVTFSVSGLTNVSDTVMVAPVKNIAADFTISHTGDIRYIGAGDTKYSVLELHRFLQDCNDQPEWSDQAQLDITDVNPSLRRTDSIIQLRGKYNIDDETATHLHGGTLTQEKNDSMWVSCVTMGEIDI